MKRYAIVRVDEDCPKEIDDKFVCNIKRDKYGIGTCYCRYGDTKEQLVKKVAQVIFRRKLKLYRKIWGVNMGSIERKDIYAQCLEVAKEIVEFLGVEE